MSTLSQVLLSIQSAILVEAPWANEPGDEAHLQSERGIRAVAHHNLHLRLATLRFGILDPMKRPPRFFEDASKIHFRHKRAEILAQVAAWTEEALLMAAYEEELEGHYQDIRKTLGEFQKVLQWSKVSSAHQQWSQGLERHEVFGECVCVCVCVWVYAPRSISLFFLLFPHPPPTSLSTPHPFFHFSQVGLVEV